MAPAHQHPLYAGDKALWLGAFALLISCAGPAPIPPAPAPTNGPASAAASHSAAPAPPPTSASPHIAQPALPSAPAQPHIVRLAAVNTTVSTGLLDALLPDFEKQSGLKIKLLERKRASDSKKGRGHGLFKAARAGHVDLIIAHYGKADVEPFVTEGLGEHPRLVFANQAALIGPRSDPAKIAGARDVVAAFEKIAVSGAPYIVNDLDGFKYLSDILWRAAGEPQKGSWYIEGAERKSKAVRLAEQRNGYVLYGVQPFLHFKNKHQSKMKIFVWEDPLLQRAMATIVVNPNRISAVNHKGALALQQYLLSAATQAKVRAFRMPGTDKQFWWPLARSNNPADLLRP